MYYDCLLSTCDIFGLQFISGGGFGKHMLMHKNDSSCHKPHNSDGEDNEIIETPPKCNVCGIQFYSSEVLDRHMLMHIDVSNSNDPKQIVAMDHSCSLWPEDCSIE